METILPLHGLGIHKWGQLESGHIGLLPAAYPSFQKSPTYMGFCFPFPLGVAILIYATENQQLLSGDIVAFGTHTNTHACFPAITDRESKNITARRFGDLEVIRLFVKENLLVKNENSPYSYHSTNM